MKKILLLFFVVFSAATFSQTVERTISLKDAETNLPIEDATVFVLKTKQTLITNSKGIASFVITGASNIQISHTSYVGITIKSTNLKAGETVFFLKSNVNNLEEIIITKKHPQKILKTLVENSINKLTIPARLKVYSREFFKMDGVYSYYNDGLLNFQISGKPNSIDTNILVEQNRSYGLIEKEISADLLGYNLNDIMENYYKFKYLNPLLESAAKKEFDFIIKTYSINKDYYIMSVVPLDNAKGLLDNFSIIYDNKDKIIIEVSAVLSAATLAKMEDKTTVGSKNIYKSFFKTIYRKTEAEYYLVSSKEEIGFERVDKKKKTDIEVRNYFITTNFSNQSFSFKENEVFKDKTLFNKSNVILSNYWSTSGLTATDEEQEIVNTLDDTE
ncbi:hypothetical protein OX284_012825 [Flavobacterium sp. SUN046]|uniref:hypothetical protein n=1 Tax=Flavobacterium sp. SUN046 TaxID=3002440 RepID=UPI002DBB7B1D|nr:hypothetical protein [Flavobacterium sp. SUN046]MEC4050319.1 hypothetical protein [Flavobacterium sp. SUN046]